MSNYKIVTIHFHDGHKQDVKCPEGTKWIEITPNFGEVYAHQTKPKLWGLMYWNSFNVCVGCVPSDRAPRAEGHTFSQLLKVEEV